MKTFLLLVVLCGLLSTAQALRRLRKCKRERKQLNVEVSLGENELDKYMTNIFESRICGTGNKAVYSDGKYMINTEGGDEVKDEWCIMVDPRSGESDDAYTVSVDLYADNDDENHLGIAYNVKDLINFDMIYYRPHGGTSRCYQSAYEEDKTTNFGLKGACPTKLEFKKWFNAKVVVTSGSNYAELYLDGVLVTKGQPMKFPKKARAGVVVSNGYDNLAHFKNLEIE